MVGMTGEQLKQVEDLFHRAKALEPEDRAAFLDETCNGALDLRADGVRRVPADERPRSMGLRRDALNVQQLAATVEHRGQQRQRDVVDQGWAIGKKGSRDNR